LRESAEIASIPGDPAVRDAALVAAAQRLAHYEIASYGTVRTYAEMLGFTDAAERLQQSLDEEHLCNDRLTRLAVLDINVEAM
jgi:ferritin-like metal-binding protein YciE